MNRRLFFFTALAATLGTSLAAQAKSPEIFTGLIEGVGAAGYDVVAYMKDNAAKPGDPAISTEWKGAKWYFTTADNLDAFKAEPEKYAPQYGGYCAYALAKGSLAKGEPEAWTVSDGKLYLNFSKQIRQTWAADIPGYVATANANWPKVLE